MGHAKTATTVLARLRFVVRRQPLGPRARFEGVEMRADRGQRAAIKVIAQRCSRHVLLGVEDAGYPLRIVG